MGPGPKERGRKGTLYVVATPIGNLEDLTERARRVLRQVELVACEDTRRTGPLLRHVGSRASMVALHRFSEEARLERVIEVLEQGRDAALVSDAGTPLLSDPGVRLVARARELSLPVVPVPGPSAAAAALSVAGLPGDTFLFLGFLPAKGGRRRRALEEVRGLPHTLVIYEAPHRIGELLREIREVLGDRRCLLAREMTKLHETYLFGPVSRLEGEVEGAKGEITLVVEGGGTGGPVDGGRLRRLVEALVGGGGLEARECADLLAGLGLGPRKELYNLALRAKEGRDHGEV